MNKLFPKIISVLFLYILLSGFNHMLADQTVDSVRYNEYRTRAVALAEENKYDSSNYYHKLSLLYDTTLQAELNANISIFWNFYYLQQMDSAKHYAYQSINKDTAVFTTTLLIKLLADSYRLAKVVHNREGNYNETINALTNAIALYNQVENAQTELIASHQDLGIAYWRMGQYELSMKEIQQGEKLTRDLSDQTDKIKYLIQAYMMYGLIHKKQSNLEKAIDSYLYVLKLIGNDKNFHARNYMATCVNLADAYQDIDQFNDAINYYQLALKHIEKIRDNKKYERLIPYYESEIYQNLGHVYIKNEEYHQSLPYLNMALSRRKAYFGLDHPEVAKTYISLGEVLTKTGSVMAELYLDSAVVYMKKFFGYSHPKLSLAYNARGEYFLSKGQYEKAFHYFDSSLICNPKVLLNNQSLYSSKIYAMNAMLGKAECLVFMQNDQGYLQNLTSLSKELTDQSHAMLTDADDAKVNEVYFSTTNHLLDQFSLPSANLPNLEWKDQLWQLMENSRSRKLLSQIEGQVALASFVPEHILVREQKLKNELTDLLYDQDDQSDSLLFLKQQEYELFTDSLEQTYPRYGELKYNTQIPGTQEIISNALQENEAMVTYYIGEKYIYVFVLAPGITHFEKIDKPANFQTMVKALNEAIKNNDANQYESLGHEMYQIIFQPVASVVNGITNLIIVPDGSLWYLNFDLLISSPTLSGDYRKMNYLIHDYSFSYAYSATLYLQEQSRVRTKPAKREMIAFSFENENSNGYMALQQVRSASMDDLPGSRKEIKMIADVYDGDFYFGRQASESNFKKLASDYAFIHLALHGEIDEDNPEKSLLRFTPLADSANDGTLYNYELYSMNLNAELAVLSACNTATGQLTKGEGVMSLGRAFTYAGCKSLILTLWEINDNISPEIMQRFYQHLADGQTKSDALANAKRDFIKEADNLKANPLYWGSFVLVGDQSALASGNELFPLVAGLIFLLLIILAGFFILRSKSRKTLRT